MGKSEVYRWIKIGGIISFVPMILAAGPLSGYFIGDYFEKKFGAPAFVLFLCIGVGFAASIMEVVKIIRLAVYLSRKQ